MIIPGLEEILKEHTVKTSRIDQNDNWNAFFNSDEWKDFIMSKAIICPTNLDTEEINNFIIKQLPGQLHVFRSYDKVLNSKEEFSYPLEYLNSIYLGSIPPHILELKVGCPIILIRNLDAHKGILLKNRLCMFQRKYETKKSNFLE